MKYLDNFPRAQGEVEPLTIVFQRIPPMPQGDDILKEMARFYNNEAVRFLDALQAHAPGGFVDAVFGELAHRKASIFRVADAPKG